MSHRSTDGSERVLTEQVGSRLLYEDTSTRVWLLELQPGESSGWHKHTCEYMYVTTRAGQTQTEYIDGRIEPQDDTVGTAVRRRADPGHRLVNKGTEIYQNIVIEFLDQP